MATEGAAAVQPVPRIRRTAMSRRQLSCLAEAGDVRGGGQVADRHGPDPGAQGPPFGVCAGEKDGPGRFAAPASSLCRMEEAHLGLEGRHGGAGWQRPADLALWHTVQGIASCLSA